MLLSVDCVPVAKFTFCTLEIALVWIHSGSALLPSGVALPSLASQTWRVIEGRDHYQPVEDRVFLC